MKLVFETPGLIDERAFTTMGLSAKPATGSPIGYFGTGLKYAIAVLVRLGCEPVVFIGRDKYIFQKKPGKFRGVDYDGLRMRRERFSLSRATNVDLPFTTTYGRNWQPWMIFRELEANTRDENGTTLLFADNVPIGGVEEKTRIVVDLPSVIEAWEKRDEIFLPEADRSRSRGVQIVERPSSFIYWRGLRVYETSKPCLFTYNILDQVELTEDRTLGNEWYARQAVAGAISSSCDEERIIEKVILAGEVNWEHRIEFNDYRAPSAAFHRVMKKNYAKANASSVNYYARYDDRPRVSTKTVFEAHPIPWTVSGEAVTDANGDPIFREPYGYKGVWRETAEQLIALMSPARKEEVGVEIEKTAAEPVLYDDLDSLALSVEPDRPSTVELPLSEDSIPF